MTTRAVQVSLENLPVACAFQRIALALRVEAEQLQIWKQGGAAGILLGLASQVDEAMDRFIRDSNRLVQVASEMPSVSPPG